jgi:hypothetical protein
MQSNPGSSSLQRIVFTAFAYLVVNASLVHAQSHANYIPRKTHNQNSKALINAIRDQLPDETDRIRSKRKWEISQFYHERTNYLVAKVRQGVFIDDDTLQTFAERVLKRIIANNPIHHPPKRILILKSPDVNAFCHLDGSFIINVGLLGRIRNESQLAFAISHEMAHFELDHIRKRITQYIENKESKAIKQNFTTLNDEHATLEEIDSVRRFIYTLGRYSREREKEADSLGFVFLKNAGYNQPQAIEVLAVLDSGTYLKYPVPNGLFSPLHFTKFPFKEFWLNQRPRIFSKKSTSTYIFSNDSINSHPDMLMRRSILNEMITSLSHPLNYQPDDLVRGAITIAEFESIESAFAGQRYDQCLFLALQQINRFPRNAYLVSVISRVFIDLIEARENGKFTTIIPSYTIGYSDDMRQVNNFIHNVSLEELGEIAFHFLNHQNNFNQHESEHYFLLWKISHLTQRLEVKEKIKNAYRARFDEHDARYALIR